MVPMKIPRANIKLSGERLNAFRKKTRMVALSNIIPQDVGGPREHRKAKRTKRKRKAFESQRKTLLHMQWAKGLQLPLQK